MLEKLVLYSPIIILVLSYILKLFWFRFSIFIDELILGDKIKYFSHILFWSIFIYIYWVCYYYKVSLFRSDDNNLDLVSLFSLVLTIWASYGIYLGFLQFMVGYDNKEKGFFLGYQKMDFLTNTNISYHLTNIWEFWVCLFLSIILPLINNFNQSNGIHYKYMWQSVVGFLLILFIFLLKFSLKVAKITIFINKKTDEGLKEVIKSDIENRYKKYFNQLIKEKFSFSARQIYFRQVNVDLNKIDTTIDKIYFLGIIYFAVLSPDFISKIEGFRKSDFVNYKHFIKEKYDLISQIDCESDELISFAISLFKIDIPILDELLKKNMCCIDSDYSFESLGVFRKKTILGVEYNEKVRRREINWFKDSEINNIHICIFKILLKMAKNKQIISQLVNLINDKISQNIDRDTYWETNRKDKLFIFEQSISDSNLRISKVNFRQIENIDVFYSLTNHGIESNSDADSIYLSLHSNIIKIDFHFKDGKHYYVKRNEIIDYFNDYEEEVWNIIFNQHKNSSKLSDGFLPNLREPEIIIDSFGAGVEKIFQNYDNKITYSRICFKYLTDNYNYIDSSVLNFSNLIDIVKTMSINYRGAFALYQLLYPENRNWDSTVEIYVEILSEVLSSRREEKEREKMYNDMVLIINSIEYGNHIGIECLKKVFDTRDVELIDEEFLKDFKKIPILNLFVVQSVLSTDTNKVRSVELKDLYEKRNLVKQYILGFSETPGIFTINNYNYKYNSLNLSMSKFLLNNINLLSSHEFGQLPLSSILLFEKFLYFKWTKANQYGQNDEQEFMINLIREKCDYKLSDYNYIINGSLLQFFTLKLLEDQGKQYLRVVNEKDFKQKFKFTLLNYLKKKQWTLDMYLYEIFEELKNFDSIVMGIYEKRLIKKEIEKIIFENFLTLD